MRLATTAVAVAAIAIGVTSVLAQQDPIAERQKLMKANGAQAKIGVAMTKGETPFDLAKAKKIFVTFEEAAQKMPALFPENSKTGEKTRASPKIWDDMADVKAKFEKLGKDSKAAEASVTDLATFKTAFAEIGKDCGGCHKAYRLEKK
ncbi:MAG TPA: cytochrome c [Pseudolabrys sp.]|nr:cytochrome c [Pseudolabrys sp.]